MNKIKENKNKMRMFYQGQLLNSSAGRMQTSSPSARTWPNQVELILIALTTNS
jgi:hypothetical protein